MDINWINLGRINNAFNITKSLFTLGMCEEAFSGRLYYELNCEIELISSIVASYLLFCSLSLGGIIVISSNSGELELKLSTLNWKVAIPCALR